MEIKLGSTAIGISVGRDKISSNYKLIILKLYSFAVTIYTLVLSTVNNSSGIKQINET